MLVVRSFQSQPLHVLRELSGGDVQVVNGDRSDTYLAATGDAIEVLHMPLEDVYLALSNGSARTEEGAAACSSSCACTCARSRDRSRWASSAAARSVG